MAKPYPNVLPGVPCWASPFFDDIVAERKWGADLLAIARGMRENGAVVVDFPGPDFEGASSEVMANLGELLGDAHCIRDAWSFQPAVHRVACNATIMQVLSQIGGRRCFPTQTRTQQFARERAMTCDALHFATRPAGFMVSVWVALEDISEENGPLVYYPGTHRWPEYSLEQLGHLPATLQVPPGEYLYQPLWQRLLEEQGIQPSVFLPRKGQALIMAGNVLHAVAPPKDGNSCWAQHTHYYYEHCGYYDPLGSAGAALMQRQAVNIGRFNPSAAKGKR